ncbi:CTP synthetase [Haloarculaceae archaeon H-GB2-1]|nr:CTP synthetase [Haloarculaceae archaeon H-GB1-1]MEA5386069.1 CTP synthetase [Haloarculaceae archaeon H-GB11]MEA5407576.1 CTP synthetase [Haloarculaceae archaeon H-GB2-1]
MTGHVIVAGTDEDDIGDALAELTTVERVDVGNRPALEEAGIHDAVAYVLTEVEQATSIAVAKDLNPDLKVVVYSRDSLPEFAKGQADLAIDPKLLDPEAVAEELLADE